MKNIRGLFVSFPGRLPVAIIFFSCLLQWTSYAQEPQKAGQATEKNPAAQDRKELKPGGPKTKDYGAGFEKFYKLGLPDVSTAKYVKLELYDYGNSSMSGFHIRSMGITGNAWMLKEDKAGKSLFIVDNCRLMEVYDHETLAKIKAREIEEKVKQGKEQKKKIIRFSYSADGRTSGKWEEVDLKKDLAKIMEYFNKKKGDEAVGRNNYEYEQMSRDGGYGMLLLTAVHAYRQGCKDEANQLAGKLFENAKEPQKVITQGMTVLAEGRYNEVMGRFFAEGDWNALGKELDGLLSTFSSGWRNAGAVRMLSGHVKERAAATEPPELADPRLTDEDRKLAVEIAGSETPTSDVFSYRRGLWVMHAGKTSRGKSGNESITDRITSRGMKSVPLLLALLKDDYLTRMDLSRIRGHSYISHRSDASAEDRNNEIYQQMRRPASRADFAASLLRPLLSNQDEYESIKEGPGGIFDACSEWYEQNKDKTPVELAKAYMADEDSSRKEEAINFLIKNGGEEDIKGIEKYFLESGASDYSAIQLAQEYVRKRGEKARDFVEKFIKKLEEVKAEDVNEGDGNDYMKKATADAIKNFNDAISSETAQDIIDGILSGRRKLEESFTSLSGKLQRESRDNAEKIILTAALNAKDPDLSLGFLSFSDRNSMAVFEFDGESEAEEAGEAPLGNVELWKKLLADERKTQRRGNDSQMTVGDSVAVSMDSKYDREAGQGRYRAFQILGTDRMMPVVRSRVAKILEGKKEMELPPYPDAKNISAEERRKIIDGLKVSPEPEKAMAGLSNDELLAVVEEADRKPEELSRFYACANKVRTVETEIPGLLKFDEVKAAEGKALDKETLEKIFAICKTSASGGLDMSVQITRKGCLGGVSIRFLKRDDKGMGYLPGQKETKGFVSAWMGGNSSYASASWPLDQDLKKVKDKKEVDLLEEALEEVETDMKDTVLAKQNEFWKSIGEWCAGKGNILYGTDMCFSAISAKKEQAPEKKPENAEGDKVKNNDIKEEGK
ncbi:MAG TPA: hypothetical protein DET40_19260 [Lentisphaeria bacterium]|nr:MAG: hypothetical protein A2X45_18090 [Lentisphaerae bacterium GWF2_50_93]HCE45687.1 hypothetical protein [Lentisphaeria bacterium]